MTRDLGPGRQLVGASIAAVERAGRSAGPVTARRVALMLLSRSQDPDRWRGLIRSAETGVISQELRGRLRDAGPAGREAAG